MNKALIALACAALIGGCAKKGRPGGGPEDRVGPFVARWSPAAGADSVSGDAPLLLTWSEAVDRRAVEDRLVVSPDTAAMVIEWDGRTLSIIPRGGWLADVTHWVWIAAGARDAHDVPMDSPFGTWFSTGDSAIHTLVVGDVRLESSPARGARLTFIPSSAPLQWRCLADSVGRYEARGLSRGLWRVTAFVDRDGDAAYDRGVEPWISHEFALEADSVVLPSLIVAVEDTAPPVVREVRPEHARRVRVGFSEALSVAPNEGFSLRDTTGLAYPIESVSLSAADPAGVRLLLGRPLRDDLMVVTASGVRDSAGLAMAETTLTFLGTSLPDTASPAVYRLLYDRSVPMRVWVMFTEPMAHEGLEGFEVFSLPGLESVGGEARWRDPQVLTWSALVRDERLLIVLSGAKDTAGRPLSPFASLLPSPADSTMPSWEAVALPP